MPLASPAVVQPEDLDDVRALLARNGNTSDLPPTAPLTLGAALELACALTVSPIDSATRRFALGWARASQASREAYDRLSGLAPHLYDETDDSMITPPALELTSILSANSLVTLRWCNYLKRFIKSLEHIGGFGPTYARGIAGAFTEMAENVPRHSGADRPAPSTGVAGFHVARRTMTFAVVDVGCGVLASLRSSERWRHLASARDALTTAVTKSATRDDKQPYGHGFRTVRDALADLGGLLRFRSDDAVLLIDGRPGHSSTYQSSTPMPGLQICVTCSLDGESTPGAVP